ncbi:MAG: HAMP domain-containing histidine kinase [Chloroflexota bacterium]|nr:HAMP domain-containing histidine kinase [Chloroflexota bacterium]
MSQQQRTRDIAVSCADALDRSPHATVVTEGPRLVRYANPAFCRLVGAPQTSVVGHTLLDVLRQDRAEPTAALLDRVYTTGEAESVADLGTDWRREDVHFIGAIWPIIANGHPEGLMVRFSDTARTIVAQQRSDDLRTVNQRLLLAGLSAQEQAEEAEFNLAMQRELARQKEEFLATVAHDLRTPLTTVMGFTQLLLRRLNRGTSLDTSQNRNALEQIEATARRMISQIDELLQRHQNQLSDFTDEVGTAKFNLSELVARVVSAQQQTREDCRISLRNDGGEIYGIWKTADVARVLGNLLANAIKYSGNRCEVEVSLRREEGKDGPQAVLDVHDMGIGIPPADLPHIFERHYRASNVGETEGLGIGLAGVHDILARYGGTLSADSTPDGGTTFTVRLPLYVPPEGPDKVAT